MNCDKFIFIYLAIFKNKIQKVLLLKLSLSKKWLNTTDRITDIDLVNNYRKIRSKENVFKYS